MPYTPDPDPWMIAAGVSIANAVGMPDSAATIAEMIAIARDRDAIGGELADVLSDKAAIEARLKELGP